MITEGAILLLQLSRGAKLNSVLQLSLAGHYMLAILSKATSLHMHHSFSIGSRTHILSRRTHGSGHPVRLILTLISHGSICYNSFVLFLSEMVHRLLIELLDHILIQDCAEALANALDIGLESQLFDVILDF